MSKSSQVPNENIEEHFVTAGPSIMGLREAFELVNRPRALNGSKKRVFLSCGFTPLHLTTFLHAHFLRVEQHKLFEIQTGLYGDLDSQFAQVQNEDMDVCVLVLEWSDFDPRLGIRSSADWTPRALKDIEDVVAKRVSWIQQAIVTIAKKMPIVLCEPTLSFPPLAFSPTYQASAFESKIRLLTSGMMAELASIANVRIASPSWLDRVSNPSTRWDVRGDLNSGFPYSLTHASSLGNILSLLARAPAPKKGLITDLDDTLWRGILGEVGANGVTWDLSNHSHSHALYQKVVQSLADTGILIAIASKNEKKNVDDAFGRTDLLVSKKSIFPIEAHWNPKSESVARILKTWNIGENDVVFVDDSATELAQVKSSFPGIECLKFPRDEKSALDLVSSLRDLFGKHAFSKEDGIRIDSIRNKAAFDEATADGGSSEDQEIFLRASEPIITASFINEPMPPRVLELINKTNQFNLNGRRIEVAEWTRYCSQPGRIVVSIDYKDKFGPLGVISVLTGHMVGESLKVDNWVLSCRAFSRRVEHQTLKQIFEHTNAQLIEFDFRATPKNGPVQTALQSLTGEVPVAGCKLSKEAFLKKCPVLYHKVVREGIES